MQTTSDSGTGSFNPYSVTGTLGFEEMAIAVVANQFNPTILKLDFLKISGIIPDDWEVQKQPILTQSVAQIVFQNGVNIVAQGRNITFSETIDATKSNPLKIPALVRQFIEKLPNADYQGISITPKIIVAFPTAKDFGRKYIVERLLAPGPWSNLGIGPVQASLNFLYQLDRCKLLVNLNESQIQQPDKPPVSALLFSGNFNYDVASYTVGERLQQLTLQLENWSKDLENFRDIVNNKFLGQEDNVFLPQ